MNKTIILIAVMLSIFTAFLVIESGDGSDGATEYINGHKYYVIEDADTAVYTDETLPAGVASNGGRIFIDCGSIKDGAFKNCKNVKHVYLEDTVKSVGASAFEGCTNLVSFDGEEGLTSIGASAFKDSGIASIVLPSTVNSIGQDAFRGCSRLSNSVLFGTNVKTLPAGVFMDSGIKVEDLRKVTSISNSAFTGTDLKVQVLSEGQSVKARNVPAVYVKDFVIEDIEIRSTLNAQDIWEYTLRLQVQEGISLMSRNSDGTYATFDSEGEIWVGTDHICSILVGTNDLHLEPVRYTIHFEDYLGMSDVIRRSGSGTYTMPSPAIGASVFKGWKIDGMTGYVTKLTESNFQTLGMNISPIAEFQEFTLLLDHSAVSSSSAYSSLPGSVKFTVNGTYPDLEDITGYEFSGWLEGSTFHSPGDTITNYSTHTVKSVWNAQMLNLTLVGADGSRTVQQVSAGTEVDIQSLSVDEPEAKRFIGWSRAENGTILTSNPRMDSDMILYSVFTDRPHHTIRYMDGTTVIGTQSGYEGRNVVIDIEDPSSEGKVFTGWRLGGSPVENGDTILLTGDIEIQSQWNVNTVNITYHIGSNAVMTYDYGDTATIDQDAGTNFGYVFAGWSTMENGSVVYTQGDTFIIKDNIDLFPCWISNGMLIVTLHDYLGRSVQTEIAPNGEFIIPSPTVRDGMAFSGWGIVQGGDPVYQTGQTLVITDSTNLYEVWTDVVEYEVSIHLHDGTVAVEKAIGGSSFKLPDVGVRIGYTFAGWAVSPDGSAVYRDGDTIRINGDIDLYEVWEAVPVFTVTVHSDPAVVNTAFTGETVSAALPSMAREGYSLLGWSTVQGGSSQYDCGSTVECRTDTDFYPVWEAMDVYTVTVHLSGSDIEQFTVYAGESITLPASMGTSDGRAHEGWTTGTDGTGRFYAVGSSFVPSQSMELFAYWSDPVTVKLILKDGDAVIQQINLTKDADFSISGIDDPSKAGYRFLGWSDSPKADGVTVDKTDVLSMSSDRILYAVWEALVKVTFHDGDAVSTAYYQKGSSISAPSWTRSGYRLTGWSHEPAGTVIGSLRANSDTDLYAVWEELNPNGGGTDVPNDPPKERGSGGGGGDDGTSIAIAFGLAVAIFVSALVLFQIHRS